MRDEVGLESSGPQSTREPFADTRGPVDPRIGEAMGLIESRLYAPPNGESLARACGLSEFHFNRLFREQTGETLAAYSRRVRLENAAIRLNGSQDPVNQIAEQLGYENQSAFTRAFHSRFG